MQALETDRKQHPQKINTFCSQHSVSPFDRWFLTFMADCEFEEYAVLKKWLRYWLTLDMNHMAVHTWSVQQQVYIV